MLLYALRVRRHLLLPLFLFETRGAGVSACAGAKCSVDSAFSLMAACSSEPVPAQPGRVLLRAAPDAVKASPRQSCAHSVPDDRLLHQLEGRTATCGRRTSGSSANCVISNSIRGQLLAVLLQRLARQRNRRQSLLRSSAITAATALPSSPEPSTPTSSRCRCLGFNRDWTVPSGSPSPCSSVISASLPDVCAPLLSRSPADATATAATAPPTASTLRNSPPPPRSLIPLQLRRLRC